MCEFLLQSPVFDGCCEEMNRIEVFLPMQMVPLVHSFPEETWRDIQTVTQIP